MQASSLSSREKTTIVTALGIAVLDSADFLYSDILPPPLIS